MNCYGPIQILSNKKQEIYEEFLEVLHANIKTKSNQIFILQGDFNAKIGRSSIKSTHKGHFSRGCENKNASLLNEFLAINNLTATKTLFKHSTRHLTTWQEKLNNKMVFYTIDYIITQQKIISYIKNSRSYSGIKLSTDHRLVKVILQIPEPHQLWKKPKQQNTKLTYQKTLYCNAKKTKMMSFNEDSINDVKSINGGFMEEVDNFKYLGGWMKCCQHDVKARKAQAWMACQKLIKIWKSSMSREIKIRLFLVTVESLLLYNAETWTLISTLTKSLDGAYTRMIRMALNISWKQHVTNEELYGDLPKFNCKIRERRLRLAGHCIRHREEIASKLVLWQPLARNPKRGRKTINYVDTLAKDTDLESTKEIENAMLNRGESWRSFITIYIYIYILVLGFAKGCHKTSFEAISSRCRIQ